MKKIWNQSVRTALILFATLSLPIFLTACGNSGTAEQPSSTLEKPTPTSSDTKKEETKPDTSNISDQEATPEPASAEQPEIADGIQVFAITALKYGSNETDYNQLLEYDSYGNIISWKNLKNGENIEAVTQYDSQDRLLSIVTAAKDELWYNYDESGNVTMISGNFGPGSEQGPFIFERSDREEYTYMLTRTTKKGYKHIYYYNNDYLLMEHLQYEPKKNSLKHTDTYTYDERGRLIGHHLIEHGSYEFEDTYTDEHYCSTGEHRLCSYGVATGSKGVREYLGVSYLVGESETDSQGRIIRDFHAANPDGDSEEGDTVTYLYTYDAAGELEQYTHIFASANKYKMSEESLWKKIRITDDDLVVAFFHVYGQDIPFCEK